MKPGAGGRVAPPSRPTLWRRLAALLLALGVAAAPARAADPPDEAALRAALALARSESVV